MEKTRPSTVASVIARMRLAAAAGRSKTETDLAAECR